jgi:hypothetical protein
MNSSSSKHLELIYGSRMRAGIAIALLLVLSGLGCAARGPAITSNADPNVDLRSFRSFDFMEPLSTDRANGVRTPLSTILMNSMTREMDRRGIGPSRDATLLVNFFVSTEERMQVRNVPTSTSFHSYRRHRYGTWGVQQTHVTQYTRGTLSIDLVDARTNVLVWEGIAEGRLRNDVRDTTQEQVNGLLSEMMQQFLPIAAID